MPNVTILLRSGSKFIGSPITYRVTSTNVGDNAVFHRVVLTVNASVSGAPVMPLRFSAAVENNGFADFDISSALQAAAETWRPVATPGNYPEISYTLDAAEDYMIDGVAYENMNGAHGTGDTVYMGALTDFERLTRTRPTRYSRKPLTSPEVVHIGKKLIVPGSTALPPSVESYIVGGDSTLPNDVYPIEAPADSYEMRFINSLGVHETVHVVCLRTAEARIVTEKHVISTQETITEFSRGTFIKQNNHEQWKMSSGPLDYAWASWFVHEFLMARWAWIAVKDPFRTDNEDLLVPCHVVPDETVPLVDRTKNEPIAIPFTVELDITGSPLYSLSN